MAGGPESPPPKEKKSCIRVFLAKFRETVTFVYAAASAAAAARKS